MNLALEDSPLRALLPEATSFGALEVLGPTVGRIRRYQYQSNDLFGTTYQSTHFHVFVVKPDS